MDERYSKDTDFLKKKNPHGNIRNEKLRKLNEKHAGKHHQ
jgi:hypothetical protein